VTLIAAIIECWFYDITPEHLAQVEKDWGKGCVSREFCNVEPYQRNGENEEGRAQARRGIGGDKEGCGRARRRNKIFQELSERVSGGREEDV